MRFLQIQQTVVAVWHENKPNKHVRFPCLHDADQLFFDRLDVIQIAADCLSHFERWLVGVCVEYT